MFTGWINEPREFVEDNGKLEIIAGEKTDFFIDPASDCKIYNAPILGNRVDGDFTITCKVKPYFKNIYDAGAIMLYISHDNWVKFAFENTDLGHTAVVSVVTDPCSDDSNGQMIEEKSIRLRMTLRKDIIGLYYSHDNTEWRMVRLFKHNIAKEEEIFLGLEAQSPMGNGCRVSFEDITFTNKCVDDLRKGNLS